MTDWVAGKAGSARTPNTAGDEVAEVIAAATVAACPSVGQPTETCLGYAVQSRSGCLVGLARQVLSKQRGPEPNSVQAALDLAPPRCGFMRTFCGFAVQPFTAALRS
jgi:hypothetical protein